MSDRDDSRHDDARQEAARFGLHPRWVNSADHHTEIPATPEDIALASALAYFLGTLRDINIHDVADLKRHWDKMTSITEWTDVVKALRIHGLTICDAKKTLKTANETDQWCSQAPAGRANKMNISEEQIEQTRNSLNLITAEIDLHEKELEAWEARAKAEAIFWAWITNHSVPAGKSRQTLDVVTEAQRGHYEAAACLKIIQLTKMKADQKVMQELLAEVDRVRAGGGGKLIHTAN